jgi:hypothetical protein
LNKFPRVARTDYHLPGALEPQKFILSQSRSQVSRQGVDRVVSPLDSGEGGASLASSARVAAHDPEFPGLFLSSSCLHGHMASFSVWLKFLVPFSCEDTCHWT